jgi:hypothetical protein
VSGGCTPAAIPFLSGPYTAYFSTPLLLASTIIHVGVVYVKSIFCISGIQNIHDRLF